MKAYLLNTLLENGIIISASLQEQIVMESKLKILKDHPYSIFHASDGRWATYLPDKEKGRRLVKRKVKKDLEDLIVRFHEDSGTSFIEAYHEFRSFHDQMVSDNTVSKYDSDEIRYFDGQEFAALPVKQMASDDIEVFIRNVIKDQELCQNAAKTLFHYISNTFDYMVRRGVISKSPMQFLRAKDFYKYTYPSKRSKKPKILSPDELNALDVRYERDLKRNPGAIPIYALIFSSLTGMRAGEIAALRWDNVVGDHIIVDTSQKYNPKTKSYYIHRTKNTKIRSFPLTEEIKELLDTIRMVEDELGFLTCFIFSDKDGPMNFRKISSCIKNKCRQVGIETHGIHAYRRTLNSAMASDGVPTSVRASLLGHSREVNEKYYTFDDTTMEDKKAVIEKAGAKLRQKIE